MKEKLLRQKAALIGMAALGLTAIGGCNKNQEASVVTYNKEDLALLTIEENNEQRNLIVKENFEDGKITYQSFTEPGLGAVLSMDKTETATGYLFEEKYSLYYEDGSIEENQAMAEIPCSIDYNIENYCECYCQGGDCLTYEQIIELEQNLNESQTLKRK